MLIYLFPAQDAVFSINQELFINKVCLQEGRYSETGFRKSTISYLSFCAGSYSEKFIPTQIFNDLALI